MAASAAQVGLNFFTGYRRDGVVVMKVSAIAKRYVRGWFVIDFVSSIPFDTFGVIMGDDVSDGLRMNKLLRVLRLFKVGDNRYVAVTSPLRHRRASSSGAGGSSSAAVVQQWCSSGAAVTSQWRSSDVAAR